MFDETQASDSQADHRYNILCMTRPSERRNQQY